MSSFLSIVPLILLAACGSVGLDAGSDGGLGEAVLSPEGSITFGRVSPYHQRPVALTVTVASVGLDPVTVVDAWLETDDVAELYMGELPFPKTISPGKEVHFDVKFNPSDVETYHAVLVVQVEGGGQIERNVTGTGCADGDEDGECGG